ncbi:hypothetical protein ONZ51_g8107 [Trametes cubensis]|uniref:DUF6534 domain-containing protein n=1 Tax=Trametes cubensis TaxID=1111947 RepID=A0AAD7X9J9_9APHY|nr:hypothetical protein ONZ51_g8107 [Trametes cubensis]
MDPRAVDGSQSFGSSIGALLLGTLCATIIYGVTLCQTFLYYQLYQRDIIVFRIFVPILVAVETFHTVLTFDCCYHYLVANYMNPASLQNFHWSLQLLVPMTGIMTVICEAFYARRVWLFGEQYRRWVILAGKQASSTREVRILYRYESTNLAVLEKHTWIVAAAYGSATAADTVLTSTLIYALLKSKSGLRRSDGVVETLVLYTINTGLLTNIVSVAVFVFALVWPHGLIWTAVSFISNKLNANAVLAA